MNYIIHTKTNNIIHEVYDVSKIFDSAGYFWFHNKNGEVLFLIENENVGHISKF